MTVFFFCLLASLSSPAEAQDTPVYVVSIVTETTGDDVSLRFVLTGPPESYSAVQDGDAIVVRIAAEAMAGLTLPVAQTPIRSMALGTEGGFTLRMSLSENRPHEIVREQSSLRLVLHAAAATGVSPTPPEAAAQPQLEPAPEATPSPTPGRERPRSVDPVPADTADLYARLFPAGYESMTVASGPVDLTRGENWYSDYRWLGLQARPWVSVSYIDGRTTQVQTRTVSSDSYWVIQPNLGLGFNPSLGPREGQWSINYTPRFRRMVNLDMPRLTSHFFDIGLDQPVAAIGTLYGSYHFSKGVLETDEVDPGREYGIGLNRVVDTSLQRFRRHTFGLGARFDFVADTEIDINVNKTRLRYGNDPGEEIFAFGDRAFFSYDTRTLNALVRRNLPAGRFLSAVFGVHDTPDQIERKQVEGRGYSYGLSLDGEIAALTSGRFMFGYRTQKNPNAAEGGREYKGFAYGVQVVRDLSEETKVGLGGERKLYLSAYAGNGFFIADAFRGDFSTRLPFAVYLRAGAGLQTNDYKASPQVNDTTFEPTLREDRIRYWVIGLSLET